MLYDIIVLESSILFCITCNCVTVTVVCDITLTFNLKFEIIKIRNKIKINRVYCLQL